MTARPTELSGITSARSATYPPELWVQRSPGTSSTQQRAVWLSWEAMVPPQTQHLGAAGGGVCPQGASIVHVRPYFSSHQSRCCHNAYSSHICSERVSGVLGVKSGAE